jgi:predicted metalloprotease
MSVALANNARLAAITWQRKQCMRLEDERESDNVEDRRGEDGAGFSLGGAHIGIGGIVLALLVSYFTGINPLAVLGLLQDHGPTASTPAHKPPADDEMSRFVAKVLASTEDTWTSVFQERGKTYTPPHLVLFTGSTPTACGTGREAMGPFYCPLDRKVYIDLGFYRELQERFHAPGEFAEAYVIAHEDGHVRESPGTPAGGGQSGGGERLVGPPGTPGGLLRRGMGEARGHPAPHP